MRSREDYTPFTVVGLLITVAILLAFQAYMIREPARIQAVEAADREGARAAGAILYAENCSACHGENGQGQVGPALNSKSLLTTTSDAVLSGLIRTGVPGTVMPAWGQDHGGPFTDEEVLRVVSFIRSWEETAPETVPVEAVPDPVRGAAIFASTCFICHGERGEGGPRAPSLNDPERLARFDDAWYRDTIAHGRPAKGMPTWGSVLSPQQIDDLVSLLSAWREGRTITPGIPLEVHLQGALFALRQRDALDAAFHLNAGMSHAAEAGTPLEGIRAVLSLITNSELTAAEARLAELLGVASMGVAIPAGSVEEGMVLFGNRCASCHGEKGTGGLGPDLYGNTFIQAASDPSLIQFILDGRKGTAMAGFSGILTPEEVASVVALLRTWQE